MKHIEPFSKEMYTGDTVSTDQYGLRAGFLDNVDITKAAARDATKHMAAFDDSGPDYTKAQGNPAHPEFKKKGDDGLPSFPAPFSRTKLSGEPKRTPGH
jgi:hypothetical protein